MNHDLTGINDLLKIQKEHIDKMKCMSRIDNEKYLRDHPEIEFIIKNFLIKLLEDRPDETLKYAGKFFNVTDFRDMYENNQK